MISTLATSSIPFVHATPDADRFLWCFILDDAAPFQIAMSVNSNIDNLKDTIKLKQQPKLDLFPASSLVLWRVSIFYDHARFS
jgi:hypothetical protein